MCRLIRLIAAAALGITAGAIILADNAVHVRQTILLPAHAAAEALERNTASEWEDVHITTDDGATLDGWFFTPLQANGSGVIAFHGVADTRLGMLDHGAFLLRAGFTVLVPDVRGHGSSGGSAGESTPHPAIDLQFLIKRSAVRHASAWIVSVGLRAP